MQDLLGGAVPLVAAGFSPPDALAALAAHLGLTGPVVSDPGRAVYRRLGLGRAPVWRVYSPGPMAGYAWRALQGARLRRPVEDSRQMGGDALLCDGRVVRLWRPRTPDDRAAPRLIVRAALTPPAART